MFLNTGNPLDKSVSTSIIFPFNPSNTQVLILEYIIDLFSIYDLPSPFINPLPYYLGNSEDSQFSNHYQQKEFSIWFILISGVKYTSIMSYLI